MVHERFAIPGRRAEPGRTVHGLKDYAAERGWISFDGGEIGQFHADVINPMRGLLDEAGLSRTSRSGLEAFRAARERATGRVGKAHLRGDLSSFPARRPGAEDYWRSKLSATVGSRRPHTVADRRRSAWP